ncbi:MAG TPA: helix-turn-helix transcriptional regulator [Gammaproteobacteria bacterium]
MGVGDRVRQVRQEKGFTQKDLAALSGVCQQMISKLEVGRAESSANIVRLALSLEVSPAWLQGISPNKYQQPEKSSERAGPPLNRKVLQACLEYLSEKFALLDQRNNYRQQAELFALCYELCMRNKNQKLTKTKMVTMLSRRIRRL